MGGSQQSSESTQNAIIQYTDPMAAMQAGAISADAAKQAAIVAKQATADAINAINRNYSQARYDVQPYRTEGVQALNQLNQYLGLDPYNPGAAPTAPKAPTQQQLNQEAKEYVQANSFAIRPASYWPNIGANQFSGITTGSGSQKNTDSNGDGPYTSNGFTVIPGVGPGLYQYQGIQTDLPDTDPNIFKNGPRGDKDFEIASSLGPAVYYNAIGEPSLNPAVSKALVDNNMSSLMNTFNTDTESYNRNLLEWQQNKDWYDQYKTEGPLTQDQITAKIGALPGYQSELEQGTDAIAKNSSAKGYLGSGRLLKELMSFGQNTFSTFYDKELNRLQSLAQMGQGAATDSGGYAMNTGSSIASLYSALGDTQANSELAKGNALAQALITANQRFKTVEIGHSSSSGSSSGGIGGLLGGIGQLVGAFGGAGV